jgi:hypothetical protein
MSSNKPNLEKIGARILAVLTVIATITGILGFLIGDLGLFGRAQAGVSDSSTEATLVALQRARMDLELQLTQIALNDQMAANAASQTALAQQADNLSATLGVVSAQQVDVIATSNAAAAMTATANAIQESQDAAATQQSVDATATALFLEQITPTATPTFTPTPLPPPTSVPEVVGDHRSVVDADVFQADDGELHFTIRTEAPIPDPPPEGLAYRWGLDTDFDASTGMAQNDIGVDMYVRVYYLDGAWLGMVRFLNAQGEETDAFRFGGVTVSGQDVVARLLPADVGLPTSFNWVAQALMRDQSFSPVPEEGHNVFLLP